MDVSYKNKLQEFCQKNKLQLPQYNLNESKDGIFVSTVAVTYNGIMLSAFGQDRKKVISEQKAAEALCHILNSYIKTGIANAQIANYNDRGHFLSIQTAPMVPLQQDPQPSQLQAQIINLKGPVTVLVDLENITSGLEEMFSTYQFLPQNNIKFHGLLSVGHHNARKNFTFSSFGHTYNFDMHMIDSTRRDACDVALIMKATVLCEIWCDNCDVPMTMVIASGDKFAPALVDAINSDFLMIENGHILQAIHANNANEIGSRLL
jgi:hypothetical protein